MSGDPRGPHDPPSADAGGEAGGRTGHEHPHHDPHHEHHLHDVGSVSEEAAKLLGALGDWAKDQGHSYAGAAAAGAAGVGEALREVDRHVATGAEECRYCPVCVVVAKVRATSPEVRQHLSSAATSLLAALAGVLATQAPDGADRRGPVERIDLGDEPAPDRPEHASPAADAEDPPWWASPGARPHETATGPDMSSGTGVQDHAASAAYADEFEDLAAEPRARRTRRPCTEEEEPR